MSGMKHLKSAELPGKHWVGAEGYEYTKKKFVPRGAAQHTMVDLYEVPPGKAAYPYHYHLKNEETFYILSGEGLLRTPEGERRVSAGDFLFFPASPQGAHKLTNVSPTEMLVYIDFDVIHDLDVAVYPDSQKIGVWGKDVNRVYPLEADVGYYEGE